MIHVLRVSLIALICGLSLSACGGGQSVREEVDAAATANATAPEMADFDAMALHLGHAHNDAEVANRISEARAAGYTDVQIAEAIGYAALRRPGRRVMYSVAYVNFKAGSSAPHNELDAALEHGRTPPALRDVEAAEEEVMEEEEAEEAVEEEDAEEEGGRRGWFGWIPGL